MYLTPGVRLLALAVALATATSFASAALSAHGDGSGGTNAAQSNALSAPIRECRKPYATRLSTNCTAILTVCAYLDRGAWTWETKACIGENSTVPTTFCFTTPSTRRTEEEAVLWSKQGLLRKQPACACEETASYINTVDERCPFTVKTCFTYDNSKTAYQATACLNETSTEAAVASSLVPPPSPSPKRNIHQRPHASRDPFDCFTSRFHPYDSALVAKEAANKLIAWHRSSPKCNARTTKAVQH